MKLKKSAFLFLLLIPVLFGIQQAFHPFPQGPLNGAIQPAPLPVWTTDTWFGGTFQHNAETYLNEHFGFRNSCVRLNNQLDYTLFGVANAREVVIGKNNYLFEKGYIQAFTGSDFAGREAISRKVRLLRYLQDTLGKKKISLIVVYAPGKGSFYPEYLPDGFSGKDKPTNLKEYVRLSREAGVHCIDMASWFRKMKDTAAHPLYPRNGVHWTEYGAQLAADSIAHQIGYISHAVIPGMRYGPFVFPDTAYERDYDLEAGMNLLLKIRTPILMHRSRFVEHPEKPGLRMLAIADSYFWGVNDNLRLQVKSIDFWYYYHSLLTGDYERAREKTGVNLKEEIEKQDVVMILATDRWLKDLGWGFIEDAARLYGKEEELSRGEVYENILEKKAEGIRLDKNWMQIEKVKARERKISLDSMIRTDAIYLYRQEHPF